MPIKGLSERRRFPRLGKVRIGEKKRSAGGKEYPSQIDHFKFDAIDPKVNDLARIACGEKPKVLDIIFLSNETEQVFSQNLMLYGSSGLKCKGDGERAQRVSGDSFIAVDCPCMDHETKLCKELARLEFFIPKIHAVGIWHIDTSSKISIININSALAMTRQVFGKITGIPFRLSIRPQDVKPDGRKKTVHVLHLQAVGSGKIGSQLNPGSEAPALKE